MCSLNDGIKIATVRDNISYDNGPGSDPEWLQTAVLRIHFISTGKSIDALRCHENKTDAVLTT